MKIPLKNEIRKPSKTLAGVTPIAVMCKPRKCPHGTCLYCPSLSVPQSYTPLSPPVIRAKLLSYSAFEQVKSRLKAFKIMNHPTNKIELIIMGGTFPSFPIKYQTAFIKFCYDALNNKKSKTLEQAKNLNQKSKHRCVALCIETRPDYCGKKQIKQMLEFGCTRVELGVQAISDKIYKKVNRGHKVKDVVLATKLLRENGFKIGYHLMPGLPGSNIIKDEAMFKKIFLDKRFKPDQLKIYPCQVLKGAALENLYKKGKYKPYTKEQIEKLLVKFYKLVPEYCRIMRIMREISPAYLTAGTIHIDLRRDLEKEIKKSKLKSKIKEIRFREIGFQLRDLKKHEKLSKKLILKTSKYQAGDGEEYFLQFVNKDNLLFGLCRLRITSDKRALIRELHVYGKSTAIGKKGNIQHTGLGKKLIKKAESLTQKHKIKNLKIISGVGAREYYKKLGYSLDKKGVYMEKDL